jgi:hypothetical protein
VISVFQHTAKLGIARETTGRNYGRILAIALTSLVFLALPKSSPGQTGPPPSTNRLGAITVSDLAVTNGQTRLVLHYPTDTNFNYIVEFKDQLLFNCSGWQPMPAPPHNAGLLSCTNDVPARFFRVRRLAQPPGALFAILANDTGRSEYDGITSDPTILGSASSLPAGTTLVGALDDTNRPFTRLATLGPPLHFVLTSNELAAANGGTLPDGPHVLYLRAEMLGGGPPPGISGTEAELAFTLLTVPPSVSLSLAPGFDSNPLGDGRTTSNPIDISLAALAKAIRVHLRILVVETAHAPDDGGGVPVTIGQAPKLLYFENSGTAFAG